MRYGKLGRGLVRYYSGMTFLHWDVISSLRSGMVRCGVVWCGGVRSGLVQYGAVWSGKHRYGMPSSVCHIILRVWFGGVWCGTVRCGGVLYGMAW